jgi:hypothetical protein
VQPPLPQERLECGRLRVGEVRTLSVPPRDAGNFDFQVAIVDQEQEQDVVAGAAAVGLSCL